MVFYLLIGIIVLIGLALLARHFVNTNPAQLAQGVRAFAAAFSALASTGLLFAGRFGLALITIGATIMAIRALRRAPAGDYGSYGGGGSGSRPHSSEVATDTLQMQLDHATGDLDGEVLQGRFAGRSLGSLGLAELLDLIADCQRDDPRSVALIETYLDRRQPDWRDRAAGGAQGQDQSAASARRRDGRSHRVVDPRSGARCRRGRDQGRASSPDDQAPSRPRRFRLSGGPAEPGQGSAVAGQALSAERLRSERAVVLNCLPSSRYEGRDGLARGSPAARPLSRIHSLQSSGGDPVIRKAVFPVAGLGTRMLPATKAIPKEMLPVVDKPIIQYAFEEARAAGVEHFIFVTGRGKSVIEDHFDRAYELDDTLLRKEQDGRARQRHGMAADAR